MKRVMRVTLLAILASAIVSMTAWADFIDVGFVNISNNSGVAAAVASQFNLRIYNEVQAEAAFTGLDLATDEVLFAFTNAVGIASSISEIYLDDGTILAQSSVENSLDGFTAFTGGGANPGNLPGGNTVVPPFVATAEFSADVDPGPPANGVNAADDILGIIYQVSGDLADVGDALADGSLRVGLHVRSIGATGDSDGFVNTPPNGVPEPSSTLLLSLGLLALGWLGRKKFRS